MLRLLFFALLACAPAPAFSAGTSQTEGRAHKGPRAYHEMCRRDPGLCAGDLAAARDPGAAPAASLTSVTFAALQDINDRINARVRSETDAALYGLSDFWTAGHHAGDCEDYMIAKKMALIRQGWAADQLLYAVVEGIETPYHAVLIVRTDHGDLVLDNLRHDVRPWDQTGYRFVIRQAANDPSTWVRVREPATFAARGGDPLDAIRSRP